MKLRCFLVLCKFHSTSVSMHILYMRQGLVIGKYVYTYERTFLKSTKIYTKINNVASGFFETNKFWCFVCKAIISDTKSVTKILLLLLLLKIYTTKEHPEQNKKAGIYNKLFIRTLQVCKVASYQQCKNYEWTWVYD